MTANEELLKAYVSDEFLKTKQKTEENIDAKINSYIAEFRNSLNEVVKEIESKDYSENFKEESAKIIGAANKAKAQAAAINKIADELVLMAPSLKDKINELKNANIALKSELDDINNKADTVGNNIGKFVGHGVKQVVTGGLAIF